MSASGWSRWRTYLERCRTGAVIGYLMRDVATRDLVGVINLNEVVRGVFSPRDLKVGGRWRDHERWAITREDWRV